MKGRQKRTTALRVDDGRCGGNRAMTGLRGGMTTATSDTSSS